MGCIYKYTNTITQDAYIGYTTRDADDRIKEHANGAGSQSLKDDIAEYGKDAFILEILEDCIIHAFLGEREKYWIAKFDTFHNGYNQTSGGGSGSTHSDEVCQKISDARIGRKHSDETKQKMSESMKGNTNGIGYSHTPEYCEQKSNNMKGKNNHRYGKKASAETRRKMSKAQRKRRQKERE